MNFGGSDSSPAGLASRRLDARTTPIVTAIVVALTVVVLLLTILVAGLLRSHAEMLKAFNELGVDFGEDGHGATPPRSIHQLAIATPASASFSPTATGPCTTSREPHLAVGAPQSP